MKKTLFRFSAILLAVAGIILAGCEQPSSSVTVYPTTSVEKPSLSVEAWKGANVLTWTPVANASSYKVYRRNTENQFTSIQNPPGNTTHYIDKAGYNSVLKDDVEYTYYVEAVVSNFSGNGGTQLLINSLSNEETVTAIIPARVPAAGEDPVVFAPAEAGFVVEANAGGDKLDVSWIVGSQLDADEEEKPEELLFDYYVEYISGTGDILPFNYQANLASKFSGSIDPSPIGTYHKFLEFPLVGGDSVVRITAVWDENNYYAPAAPLSKNYTGVVALDNVTGVTAGSAYAGEFTLTWSEVTGATGYDVYRALISAGGPGTGTTNSGTLTGSNPVISGYALVGSTTKNGTTITYTDASFDGLNKYLYVIIAKNATARSAGPALYVQEKVLTPEIDGFNVAANVVTEIDGSIVISVRWPKAEGVTYTLSRAELEYSDVNTITKVGTYTSIPAEALSDKDGRVIHIATIGTEAAQVAVGKSYRYRVVASKDGGVIAERFANVNSAPFGRFINGTPVVTPDAGVLYGYSIALSVPLGYIDLSYELYAAEYYNNQIVSGWIEVATVPSGGSTTVKWIAPDPRKRYVFSQVTKTGTVTLVNNAANEGVTATASPTYSTLGLYSGIFASLGETTYALYISVTTLGSNYADSVLYKALYGTNIYRAKGPTPGADGTNYDVNKVSSVGFVTAAAGQNVATSGAFAAFTIPQYTLYFTVPKTTTIPSTAAVGTSETYNIATESGAGFTQFDTYTLTRQSATQVDGSL
jgi:hypothetical protein